MRRTAACAWLHLVWAMTKRGRKRECRGVACLSFHVSVLECRIVWVLRAGLLVMGGEPGLGLNSERLLYNVQNHNYFVSLDSRTSAGSWLMHSTKIS